MNKTVDQIEKELDAKIPRSVVEERDGGGGRMLSYLSGHYVIDRLNKIFGPLNWSKQVTDIREVVNTVNKRQRDGSYKEEKYPAYIVKVVLTVKSDDSPYMTIKEAYGYGADKSGLNAHELAIKEAVTDALKVAAKDLGMSLGLALYSKEQENVEDDEQPAPPSPRAQPVQKQTVVEKDAKREESSGSDDAEKAKDVLRSTIRSYVKVAIKKGTTTMDKVKEHLKSSFDADSLDSVPTVEKLEGILEYVKGLS